LETRQPPEHLRFALNDELPPDIGLLAVEKTSRQFHARHSALARSYLYQLSRRRTAFGKPFVWWIRDELDLSRLREAAALFEARHGFRSFTDDDPARTSTRVLVPRIELREEGDLVLLRMVGSHFLWKMVRRVVGVVAEVGRGAMAVEQAKEFLLRAS